MTTKKLLTIALTLVIAIQFGCNSKTESLNTSASVEVLGQMNRDFAKALNARDAAAAASLYDENASILPPNEQIVTGRANIQKYWQGLIDAGLIDGAVKTIDAKSDGKLGYEIGSYLLHIKGPKGDTIVDKGKYTEVLKLDSASGKWVSIYGMWSADEPTK